MTKRADSHECKALRDLFEVRLFPDEDDGEELTRKARCKACLKLFQPSLVVGGGGGSTRRMRQHVGACPKLPDAIKTLFTCHGGSELDSEAASKPKKHKPAPLPPPGPGNIKNFLAKLPESRSESLSMKLAKWAFHARLPFNAFSDPLFRDFIHSAVPQFEPPSGRVLGSTLLDRVVADMDVDIRKLLASAGAVQLQVDSVTDNVGASSFCATLVCESKPYFYKSFAHDGTSEDANYIRDRVSELIDEIEALGSTVISVTSDNCAVMALARKKLQAKYPGKVFLGCQAHCANLLAKDLLSLEVAGRGGVDDRGQVAVIPPSCPARVLTDKIRAIVACVRKVTVRARYDKIRLNAALVQLEHDKKPHHPRKMVLNGETRWTSNWRMFRFARENKVPLQTAVLDEQLRSSFASELKVLSLFACLQCCSRAV